MARTFWQFLAAATLGAGLLATPLQAQDALIPEKRLTLMAGTDLPGGDLQNIFDTTLQACIQACLGDDQCRALTYNERARACFPKSDGAGQPTVFDGAVSGRISVISSEQRLRAQVRAAAAPFLTKDMLSDAAKQARLMPAMTQVSIYDDLNPPALEAGGHLVEAARVMAQLVARDDRADDWANLSRLTLATNSDGDNDAAGTARMMAINAYLRAGDDPVAARALMYFAQASERLDRGQEALTALRLAAKLSPGDTTIATGLEQAADRYGMRVSDTEIESDAKQPRFCAVMTHDLSPDTDYTPYLRMPEGDLTVDASDKRLCIAGLAHGANVKITLRAGLPAADGETLARDVTLEGYIRDRAPEVRFTGRGYVLPASGDQRLSVVTVNADQVDLALRRISDRNLIRAISEDMFAKPLDGWRSDYFSGDMTREIWRGSVQTAKPANGDTQNADLTTSIAIPAEAGPLEPGIYILEANLPDADLSDTGVATQWFVISDFGISTYSGTDGLTVSVRSLRDTSPKTGAEVALVSRSNEVLARTLTDDEGVAHFAPGLALGTAGAAPALVTVTDWQGEGAARLPADMAFLSLTDPEFDLSDRGVEGLPPAPPIDLFVSTDRGAYRVGETINATILARDVQTRALQNLPLTAVILRPDGVEAARIAPAQVAAGGSVLAWQIPGNAPRGSWRIELRAQADGPALDTERVLVEDFLPERIDFAPTLPAGPAKAGSTLDLSLDARWLFGAPAADLPVEGMMRLQPSRDLAAFPGYVFGREDDATQPETQSLPAGVTDAQGHYATTVTIPAADELGARPVTAEIIVDVREGAGRPVERTQSTVIMPDQPVIGLKPMFEGGTVSENDEAQFSLISVGPDQKPVAQSVRWVLNRLDTDYQWYSMNGDWNWEEIVSRKRVDEGTAETGDAPAEIAARVEWGQYELVVEPTSGQGGQTTTQFYAGWGAVASSGTTTPDRLRVVLDKPAYRTGDTARVKVEALADGLGVVSVLANSVVSMQTVALRAGDNDIDLPVTDAWGAGAYVTVSAIRPLGEAAAGGRTPARALGLAHAAVDPGARKLNATIDAPAETRPRGTIPVVLRVDGAAGDTVFATVAAVDQGILNLTKYTPPDPSTHYFGQRRLGVALRDLYGRLILATGAPDGALREGGDAMAAGADAPPPTEQLMSWFSGPVTLGADGTARIDVPVGDFNGEVRVMAVLWSERAVGQSDATVLVRDPVIMTVTAPAFLAPGDQAQIGLRLTHATGPAGEMGLAIAQTAGRAALDLTLQQDHVTLAEKAEAQIQIPVTAGNAEGRAELRLTLTTPDGLALTKDITIPVALNETDIQRQDRLVIAPGASATLPPALTAEMMPGPMLTAAVGPYGRLDVAGALARLSRYPYGCTEQLTSGAMPLLYLPNLAAIEGVDGGDTGKAVQDAITEILTRQASNGGFGLWSADSGDLWLESYVTDFLSRARSTGFQVPDAAFAQAIDNLRNRVNYATEPSSASDSDNAALAYALAVLARERAATVGDLRYYVDTAAGAFNTPMAAGNLGAALASYGDQLRADRMFTQARNLLNLGSPAPYAYRPDYGTKLRDGTALLAAAAEARTQVIDLTDLTSRVAERIARANDAGDTLSTQESVWMVMAAQALAATPPAATLNGVSLNQPVASLPDADASIGNPGDTPLEVTLTATGKPISPPRAGGRGYNITRDYYTTEGAAIDPASVAQGTRIVVVVRVSPQGEGGGRLIVTDPLPAGWEIDNPNLLRAGDISALDWLDDQSPAEMTEFRADRFAAAVTWTSTDAFTLAYIVRAVTPGTYRHPAASVEDMYRPEYRGWSDGGTVIVTP